MVIYDIAWSADGRMLALARDDGYIELRSTTGQPPIYFNVSTQNIVSADWNPFQTSRVALSTHPGYVQVLDISGEQVTNVFNLDAEPFVTKVRWNPDGSYLATLGDEGVDETRVRVWDNSTGSLVATYEDGWSLTDIAWNPQNANQLLITGVLNREGAEILVWDVSNNSIIWKALEPDSEVLYIAWNADGTEFASMTGLEDGALVRIHDASTGEAITILSTGMRFSGGVSWSPSPYLAIRDAREIQIWDTANISLITSIQADDYISTIIWSPDGTQLAYGGADGKIGISSVIVSTPINPK